MSFGYNDGTKIDVEDCETVLICQDGRSCFQSFVFRKDKNAFILDETQESRDVLFNFVRETYGKE